MFSMQTAKADNRIKAVIYHKITICLQILTMACLNRASLRLTVLVLQAFSYGGVE